MGHNFDEQHVRELLRGEFTIDIPNFKKWNPDTRGRRSWFALSVDWFRDPKVSRLTDSEQAFWLRLVSLRATQGKLLDRCTRAWLVLHVGSKGTSVVLRLLKLLNLGLIDLRSVSLQTRQTVQDKQTEEEEASPPSASPPSRFAPGLRITEIDPVNKVFKVVNEPPVNSDHAPPTTHDLLSEKGKALFRRRLGADFESEFEKCVVYWEAQGYGRKPFPVVFGRWCDQFEKQRSETPTTRGLTQEEWEEASK